MTIKHTFTPPSLPFSPEFQSSMNEHELCGNGF